MKLLKLIFAFFFSVAYATDPTFVSPLLPGTVYFADTRDPTATENFVNTTLTVGPYTVVDFPSQFYWFNTATNTIFDYMGGANGAMVWTARGYTAPARVFTALTPALNSAAQISTTRDVYVSYPVDIQIGAALISNSSGTAALVYSNSASCSSGITTVAQGTNAASGILNLVNTATVNLSGVIPAGKYACITTTVNVGTVSFTARPGQQVQL